MNLTREQRLGRGCLPKPRGSARVNEEPGREGIAYPQITPLPSQSAPLPPQHPSVPQPETAAPQNSPVPSLPRLLSAANPIRGGHASLLALRLLRSPDTLAVRVSPAPSALRRPSPGKEIEAERGRRPRKGSRRGLAGKRHVLTARAPETVGSAHSQAAIEVGGAGRLCEEGDS